MIAKYDDAKFDGNGYTGGRVLHTLWGLWTPRNSRRSGWTLGKEAIRRDSFLFHLFAFLPCEWLALTVLYPTYLL